MDGTLTGLYLTLGIFSSKILQIVFRAYKTVIRTILAIACWKFAQRLICAVGWYIFGIAIHVIQKNLHLGM